jgi:hypothetical protein
MVFQSFEIRHPAIIVPSNTGERLNYGSENISKKICRERIESVGDTATTASASDNSSTNSSKDATSTRIKIDVTEVAGARLYYQAVELSKKLENKRAEHLSNTYRAPPKTFTKNRAKASAPGKVSQRKFLKTRSILAPVSEITPTMEEKKPASKEEIVRGKKCAQRLYSLSTKQQELGKKRREEIAERLRKKNSLPQSRDYGTLSPSRASDMYLKGKRKVQQKEARLQSLRRRVVDQIRKNQEFTLAEGAFARCDDPDFQERIHISRYGNLVEFIEDADDSRIADSTINIENSTIASQSVFTNSHAECDAVDHVPSSIAGSDMMSYVSYPGEAFKYPHKMQLARDLLVTQHAAMARRA